MIHHISNEHLTIAKVEEILTNGYKLELGENAKRRITNCRKYLDEKNAEHRKTHLWCNNRIRLTMQHLG